MNGNVKTGLVMGLLHSTCSPVSITQCPKGVNEALGKNTRTGIILNMGGIELGVGRNTI